MKKISFWKATPLFMIIAFLEIVLYIRFIFPHIHGDTAQLIAIILVLMIVPRATAYIMFETFVEV